MPKQPAIEALINKIDGDTADVSHVLHGGNHYWFAYIGLLKVDKFHCTFS
jgi:poly-D-alanine transfer protein DltD